MAQLPRNRRDLVRSTLKVRYEQQELPPRVSRISSDAPCELGTTGLTQASLAIRLSRTFNPSFAARESLDLPSLVPKIVFLWRIRVSPSRWTSTSPKQVKDGLQSTGHSSTAPSAAKDLAIHRHSRHQQNFLTSLKGFHMHESKFDAAVRLGTKIKLAQACSDFADTGEPFDAIWGELDFQDFDLLGYTEVGSAVMEETLPAEI